MTAGIYALWFGKCKRPYIGQSVNIEHRVAVHFKMLKDNKSHNVRMQNAFNKYAKFSWQILEQCGTTKLNDREVWWFNYFGGFDNTLNCREPGDSSRMSEETKQRISLALLGKFKGKKKPHSEEAKENIRQARIGKTHSEEAKRNMSLAHTGHTLSEETKQRISIAIKLNRAKRRSRNG